MLNYPVLDTFILVFLINNINVNALVLLKKENSETYKSKTSNKKNSIIKCSNKTNLNILAVTFLFDSVIDYFAMQKVKQCFVRHSRYLGEIFVNKLCSCDIN